ncbi:MAG: hypothetical protein J6L83_06330 [Clostridia bacterium]|nr:hypothetical protein [Clostridia bacterium]
MDRINKDLSTPQALYVIQHNPIKLPTKKELLPCTKPSAKHLIRSLILMCIFVIIAIVLIAYTASEFAFIDGYNDLLRNPGSEYISFVNAFDQAETTEGLKEKWNPVEMAWLKRGIWINWNFVSDVLQNNSISSGEEFNDAFSYALEQKHFDTSSSVWLPTAAVICILVPLNIFFIAKFFSKKSEYEKNKKKYIETVEKNKPLQEYNENVYPKLYEEWKAKESEIIPKYNDWIAKLKKDKAELEESISKVYEQIPEKYRYRIYVQKIYDLMSPPHNLSFEEALSTFIFNSEFKN